eukprot:9489939-Pyramimonas_sp.AAC.2
MPLYTLNMPCMQSPVSRLLEQSPTRLSIDTDRWERSMHQHQPIRGLERQVGESGRQCGT